MKKITSIDRDTAKMIHARVTEIMQKAATELGLTCRQPRVKINWDTSGTAPEGVTIIIVLDVADFLALASLYCLEPEDLGRKFTSGGETFRVTGINPLRKNKVMAERLSDGRVCFWHHMVVARKLGREVSAEQTLAASGL